MIRLHIEKSSATQVAHPTVRPAIAADYAAIRDLLHDSDAYHARHMPARARAPAEPRFTREEVAELLANDQCLLLVADAHGAVAGFLEASLRHPSVPDETDTPWCGVNNLAVRKDVRRQGIGSALLRSAECWARSKGVTQLRLTVYEFNAGAHAFYRRLGYATHARELIRFLDEEDDDTCQTTERSASGMTTTDAADTTARTAGTGAPLVTHRAGPYGPEHLDALRDLINLHVGAALPGWWLPAEVIGAALERNRGQYVIDPWAVDRATFVVGTPYRLASAAHVLRYGADESVGPSYRGSGTIAWAVGMPDKPEALHTVLRAALERLTAWGVPCAHGWDAGLPVGPLAGVPDAWPHVGDALRRAGFRSGEDEPREALFGGRIAGIAPPGAPPLAGLSVRRITGEWCSALFRAELEGAVIGRCEVNADLTRSGERPALRGWAELDEMHVEERWRRRGVGSWLVRHAVEWLRLAGCDRIVLSVAADDEARGAARFYRPFGWDVFVRETRSWRRTATLGDR